jgi:hypothetical protein
MLRFRVFMGLASCVEIYLLGKRQARHVLEAPANNCIKNFVDI